MTDTKAIFDQLKKRDDAIKPPDAQKEWAWLTAMYEDQARALTTSMLAELKMGLADNTTPIEMGGLLRQAVNAAATIYKRSPTRWLTKGGKRLEEASAEHKAAMAAMERAQADLSWRLIDRLRTLHEQAAFRFYPSDERKAVVMRVFEPQNVLRDPSPMAGDLMDEDTAFALGLEGGLFELWYRLEDRSWAMQWIDEKGNALGEQPFSAQPVPFKSPYPKLPVQMIYATSSGGKTWIPPRQSRMGWIKALTATGNDSLALVALQSAAQRVYKRDDPTHQLPRVAGAGVVLNIGKDEEVEDLTPSSALDQLLEVLKIYARFFALGESLPGNQFDPEKSAVTGAALRVLLAPLIDKREDQVPLVLPDERAAFGRFRGVHNVHAKAWGVEPLDPETDLDVEVPDLEAPTTEVEQGNQSTRQLAIGLASTIDLLQRDFGITRDSAVKRYGRVKSDNDIYPPLARPAPDGPNNTEPPPNAEKKSPDVLKKKPSVISAVRSGNK